ncbi:hypothetical protein FQA39_LY18794 [Lamprigera yunnana]|nr:hypothetical protein FQA39_LY18794 [Lamprigera yunnana]
MEGSPDEQQWNERSSAFAEARARLMCGSGADPAVAPIPTAPRCAGLCHRRPAGSRESRSGAATGNRAEPDLAPAWRTAEDGREQPVAKEGPAEAPGCTCRWMIAHGRAAGSTHEPVETRLLPRLRPLGGPIRRSAGPGCRAGEQSAVVRNCPDRSESPKEKQCASARPQSTMRRPANEPTDPYPKDCHVRKGKLQVEDAEHKPLSSEETTAVARFVSGWPACNAASESAEVQQMLTAILRRFSEGNAVAAAALTSAPDVAGGAIGRTPRDMNAESVEVTTTTWQHFPAANATFDVKTHWNFGERPRLGLITTKGSASHLSLGWRISWDNRPCSHPAHAGEHRIRAESHGCQAAKVFGADNGADVRAAPCTG